MPDSRTKAILAVLARGREEKLGQKVLRILGAATFDEALANYEKLGRAERASLDEALNAMAENAGAAFVISVDNAMR
ncbi:MAG TPA: hypothetical protein VF824_21460 [Thermoanaerobaculia bacterium]|jgi:hypothetical protein